MVGCLTTILFLRIVSSIRLWLDRIRTKLIQNVCRVNHITSIIYVGRHEPELRELEKFSLVDVHGAFELTL